MKLATVALGLFALTLQACAAGARPEAMRPQTPPTVAKQHAGAVRVAVSGGNETNPLWTSEISSEAFGQALSEAIRQSSVFADVRAAAPSDYLLDVVLLDVDQPMVGLSMTVTLTARWSLVSGKTNQTIWKSDISKSYTAAMSDAFAAVKRLRLANEGAARENIKAGLEELSKVTL